MTGESNSEGENKILDCCRRYANNPNLKISDLADECKNKLHNKEYCKKLISAYGRMSEGEIFKNDISDAFALLFLNDFEEEGIGSLTKALNSMGLYLEYREKHGVPHSNLRNKCREIADKYSIHFGHKKITYIFTANEEAVFDISSAFKENKCIDWSVFRNTEYKVGDIVYIYIAKKGVKHRCIISKVNISKEELIDNDKFWKIEEGRLQDAYIRLCLEKSVHGVPYNDLMKHDLTTVLTPHQISPPKLTQYLDSLFDGFESYEMAEEATSTSYTKSDFLKDIFISEESYNQLHSLFKQKRNVILQGPPGVGKTFMAKRLAWSIMGKVDNNRMKIIQFHQSYSYEDFIEGYRPNKNRGFDLVRGPFYEFCKKAGEDENNNHFFIIDEINRGNVSKIFGELLMLIEPDKRGSDNRLSLLYSKEEFSVPKNVYLIGMMNTADRGLTHIDYALRRRFSFFSVEPAFDSDSFKKMINEHENATLRKVIKCVKEINSAICDDDSLGLEFRIGHSYFLNRDDDVSTETWLYNIVHYELIPLLREYWFDNEKSRSRWSDDLKRLVQ